MINQIRDIVQNLINKLNNSIKLTGLMEFSLTHILIKLEFNSKIYKYIIQTNDYSLYKEGICLYKDESNDINSLVLLIFSLVLKDNISFLEKENTKKESSILDDCNFKVPKIDESLCGLNKLDQIYLYVKIFESDDSINNIIINKNISLNKINSVFNITRTEISNLKVGDIINLDKWYNEYLTKGSRIVDNNNKKLYGNGCIFGIRDGSSPEKLQKIPEFKSYFLAKVNIIDYQIAPKNRCIKKFSQLNSFNIDLPIFFKYRVFRLNNYQEGWISDEDGYFNGYEILKNDIIYISDQTNKIECGYYFVV